MRSDRWSAERAQARSVSTPRQCPQCGSPQDALRPSEAFVECTACGASLHVDPDRHVTHVTVDPRIARSEAEATFRREMRGWWCDGLRRPKVLAIEDVRFPFWLARAGGQTLPVPAAATRTSNLAGLAMPPGRIRAFERADATAAVIVPVAVTLEGAADRARSSPALTPVLGETSGRRREVFAEQLRETALLAHLPFWRIRYDLGHRDGEAWIDAASGQVILEVPRPPGEAPLSSSDHFFIASRLVPLVGLWALVFAGEILSVIGGPGLVLSWPWVRRALLRWARSNVRGAMERGRS